MDAFMRRNAAETREQDAVVLAKERATVQGHLATVSRTNNCCHRKRGRFVLSPPLEDQL